MHREVFETEYDLVENIKRKLYTGRYIKGENGYIRPCMTRVLGWDPGKRMDHAGLCILDKCYDNTYRILAIDEWKNVDWVQQFQNLERIAKILEVDVFVFDANGPGSTCEDIFNQLDHNGVPLYPYIKSIEMIPVYSHTKQFKLDVYRELKNIIINNRFKFPRGIKNLEDQFAALEIDNNDKISHKNGTFIDMPSAVMIASSVFIVKKYKNTQSTNQIWFID